MTGTLDKLFTAEDRQRIAAAVREAEVRTSGEIVPYVVAQSDQYEEAEWRAGFVCGVLAFAGFTVVRSFTVAWVPLDVMEIALATLGAGALGMLAVRLLPGVKRLCAGARMVDQRVGQRAAEAFIREEVFNTRERTGILIFVSLLERRVLVVGDSGIHAKVKQEDWDGIVRRVVEGITRGKPVEGLVEAIKACGALLEAHGVARRRDDRDELSDSLRVDKD
ncbi:MAG: hypothetical protein AB1428_00910 [Bacteroidota bacterium]